MGVGTSILLIAAGAILKYAVTTDVSGINIQTVGLILLIVGIVGLAISLLYMAMWNDRGRRPAAPDEVPPPPRDRYYDR